MDKLDALAHLRQTCSKTEKSRYYVRTKLADWGLEDFQDEIIEQLETENFLNEERFAQAFVNDKYKFQKWGRIKIRYQLKGMQVSDEIIKGALNSIDEQEYSAMIQLELSKKKSSLKVNDKYQLRQKLFQYGAQRGYETDILNKVLDGLE